MPYYISNPYLEYELKHCTTFYNCQKSRLKYCLKYELHSELMQ